MPRSVQFPLFLNDTAAYSADILLAIISCQTVDESRFKRKGAQR